MTSSHRLGMQIAWISWTVASVVLATACLRDGASGVGGAGGVGHAPEANAPDAGGVLAAAASGGAGSAGWTAAVSGRAGSAGSSAAVGGSSGVEPIAAGAPAAKTAGAAGSGAITGHSSGMGSANSSNDGAVLSASIVMDDVQPGEEAHECVIVELPNAAPLWIDALHASLSAGTHHLIVDRRTSANELLTTAQTCSPTMAGDNTRLIIAQQRETRLQLPGGVAYRLDAHQRIFLQLHFINFEDHPLHITGTVELLAADSGTTPKEAKSLFAGSTSIAIPARQAASVRYFHAPGASGQPTWHVFALTSHTHHLGVRSTIERVATLDAADSPPLHESLDWSEPPLTMFSAPLTFDGSDGLRLICRYMNTTTRDVGFGTGVDDEMCFMWMYYFVE